MSVNLQKSAARKTIFFPMPKKSCLLPLEKWQMHPKKSHRRSAMRTIRFPSIYDADGNELKVTQGSYVPLLENPDRNVRKAASESRTAHSKAQESLPRRSSTGQIKQLIFYAKARRYNSTLEAALAETEVPVSVYRNLIDAVNANLEYLHKYIALRKKLTGSEELHMYDLYTPIISDADKEIPYEKSKGNHHRSFAAPRRGFIFKVLTEGFNNRWIDVYENEGKRGGAYSAGGDPHPYVLLNQKDTLDSMFTIAHERATPFTPIIR